VKARDVLSDLQRRGQIEGYLQDNVCVALYLANKCDESGDESEIIGRLQHLFLFFLLRLSSPMSHGISSFAIDSLN
jgi:hypothetical protein